MTQLNIRDFPEKLLADLKSQAVYAKMTLRDYVISNLQQIVDNKAKRDNKTKSQSNNRLSD